LSENSEKPSDLVPVTDTLKIIKYFDESAKTKADVLVWTKKNNIIAKCHIISLSQSEKMIYISKTNADDPLKFCEDLYEAGDRCFLNVRMERATLFFTTKFESKSFPQLKFKLPEKLFKVQRRQKPRFKVLQGYILRLTFKHPSDLTLEIKKTVFDVSSGGLSFLIDVKDSPDFKIGQVLLNLTFSIRGREFNLSGKIVYCKPFYETSRVQRAPQSKIGLQFSDIQEMDAAFIEDYVIEENRKYFSRFL
jgi:c-di-GMP-binding flagellar brake protein YcgR